VNNRPKIKKGIVFGVKTPTEKEATKKRENACNIQEELLILN
jgi:hypothetical protein